jgi:nicotine blue oxidoreductase
LGRPKADVLLGGSRLIDRAVRLLRDGGCDPVLVVVRSPATTAEGADAIVNPHPDVGMGSSLSIGLTAVDDDACVIVLVDQVGITPEDIQLVRDTYLAGAPIVVARRGGHRSHPVLVGRDWFADFAGSAEGDRGARDFLDSHPELVTFVELPDVVDDIDTPEDLSRAEAALDAP